MRFTQTYDFAWPETTLAPMLPLPDGVPTRQTPEDLIGPVNAKIVKQHFEMTLRFKTNPDGFEKGMRSKFTEEEGQLVGQIYKLLRQHAWWPDRFDSVGRLIFGAGCFCSAADYDRTQRAITDNDIDGLINYFSPGFVELVKRKIMGSK